MNLHSAEIMNISVLPVCTKVQVQKNKSSWFKFAVEFQALRTSQESEMKAEHEHLSKRFASRESREDRFLLLTLMGMWQQGLKFLHQKWNLLFCGFFPIDLKAFGGIMTGGKMEKTDFENDFFITFPLFLCI